MTESDLIPHSPEWLRALQSHNPQQAHHTRKIIQKCGTECCSVCGDGPATDYRVTHSPLRVRVCDDCKVIQEEMYESKFLPLSN